LVVVVLGGANVETYAESEGISAHVAKGYLIAALDRLADHYEAPATGSLRIPKKTA
jgi:hypothetical protein